MFRALGWFLFSLLVPGVGLWRQNRKVLSLVFWLSTQCLLASAVWLYAEDPAPRVWLFIVGLPIYAVLFVTQAVLGARRVEGSLAPWWSVAAFTVVFVSLNTAMNLANTDRVESYKVPSGSMRPTLVEGDQFYVLLDQERYPLTRGAPVVFLDPVKNVTYVKRIIGLPNETVEWDGEHLTIDGDLSLSTDERCTDVSELGNACRVEAYEGHRWRIFTRPHAATSPEGSWTVGADEVFVMGDNRANSLDSRTTGAVPIDWLIGTARVIHFSWPNHARIGQAIDLDAR